MKATAIISGGMDSATLAYYLKSTGQYTELEFVSFDYGQRHKRELECAKTIAASLSAKHQVIDITGIGALLKGSALTDDIEVPHGHYEAENMRLTVVPNRNAIMLSIAYGIACVNDSAVLACGVHAGDHHIYPDCRPQFIDALNEALRLGTDGHRDDGLKVTAPFVDITKTDICKLGSSLNVPFEDTWTCYEGGDVHCGMCGACQERREAFSDSGTPDPTQYRA